MAYFAFQWHILDDCDQRCKHCYIFHGNNGVPLTRMDGPHIEKTLENCLDFCRTFRREPEFYITGGDPILHPDFWRLLEKLHDRSIPFTIMGNPFHLTDQVCRRMAKLGCKKYQMSLDGLRQTHDWFRKPGSFDTTLEKIACINRSGMHSVIMTTVSSKNIDEIPDLIDVVAAHQVDVFAFSRYCPTAGDTTNGISPDRYRDFLLECDKKFDHYNQLYFSGQGRTWCNRKDHLWTLLAYEQGKFRIPNDAKEGIIYSGCNCGNCHLTILPTGDVYACRRFQGKVGNVFQDQLSDLWLHQMEDYRHYDRFEKCAKCELLAFCRGCPAVAYGTSGSFYAPDPQCWKQKNAITGQTL